MSAFLRLSRVAGIVGGMLLLGAASAQASDATVLADRAGFLVGHAHRCGIMDARLRRSVALVDKLIAAYSMDDDDKDAAQTQFAERVLTSALADRLDDPLPSCAAVRAQLARLERHRLPAAPHPGNPAEGQMANSNRSGERPARAGAAPKPATSAKPAATRPEELTPEKRAALDLRHTAKQLRGRPPSI